MSLDVRHVTNGKKQIYRIIDSLAETFDIYNTLEEVPESIRHYAANEKLTFCEPDIARMFGVLDVLYPNFPNCELKGYEGRQCIAESCKYADEAGGYTNCPYFDKTWVNKALEE